MSDTNKESEELRRAALRVLNDALNYGPTAMSFELGISSATQEALDAQQSRIDDYRARVQQNVHDPSTKAAYEHWLDFFQRQNDEARQEMLSGERRRAWETAEHARQTENREIERRSRRIEHP